MPAAAPPLTLARGVAAAGGTDTDQHPPPARLPHLWQVDVVRLLTFGAVIAVHSIAFTEQPNDRVAAGVMMLLQFGREVFFSLTGFVLVYSAFGRPLRVGSFWRKRILYVAVPYVTWTGIYYAYEVFGHQHLHPSISGFATDLLYGSAMYHLYFLLVTVQLYLVFPLILRFVRSTADRALPVLAVVSIANLGWLAACQYVATPSAGVGKWVFQHAYELLPTYSMYVLAGCYAAIHLPRLHELTREKAGRLTGVAAGAVAVALTVYALQLSYMAPRVANDVLQPAMAFTCLAAVIALYIPGARWADGPRRHQHHIEVLSDASFGIYLAHPLVLAALLDYAGFGNNGQKLPAPLATFFGYFITATGATLITLAARRTPLSLALSGRPWRAQVKRQARPSGVGTSTTKEEDTSELTTIGHLLRSRSAPDRPAILSGADGAGIGWADVSSLAGRWRACGFTGPVGLALSDPVAMAANFAAALASGTVVAPLDPAAPDAALGTSIRQLGLGSLVLDPGRTTDLPVAIWTGRHDDLEHLTAAPAGAAVPALPREPAGVRALMCSSGTTGNPKVIPLTETQLLETAGAVAAELRLTEDDRGYSPLPLFHINGLVVGVLSALVAGSSIVVDRQFSRRGFWPTVERCEATWLNLVPAIFSILAGPATSEPGGTVIPSDGRIRLARSASAPLPNAVRERFERLTGIPIVETYGMTEAASQITANPIGAVKGGSVGLPAGVELTVTGSDGEVQTPGAIGRVRIRGSRVTRHYWSLDSGSWSVRHALDSEGWLDTGDIGLLDPEGYLYLIGRDGDVVNRGGEKVHPREIEEVLLSDPRVAAAVVVGRPHPVSGEEPVAYVLPTIGAAEQPERLMAELDQLCELTLSRFKCPAAIHVTPSLPTGPTGKVRRAEVQSMAKETAYEAGGTA